MRLPGRRTLTLRWAGLGVAVIGYAHAVDPRFRFQVFFIPFGPAPELGVSALRGP